MGMIDYGRFARILKRCGEIAAAPGMNASVVQVYGGVLASNATAFLAADGGVTAAESAHAKAEKAAEDALDALDAPYRVARSTAAAFVSGIKLPETLKVQRTDTDKVTAIESLQKVLSDHASEEWASALAQGEFGQKASVALKAIKEATPAGHARRASTTKSSAAARARRGRHQGLRPALASPRLLDAHRGGARLPSAERPTSRMSARTAACASKRVRASCAKSEKAFRRVACRGPPSRASRARFVCAWGSSIIGKTSAG